MTIPHMGYGNDSMILGKIGDISRFSNQRTQLAFSDLDPAIYQSGNFNTSYTRMSK